MKLWKKVRMLWKRRRFEADLAEEVRIHRQMSGARAFGSEAIALEESRAVWGFGLVDSVIQDLRYAVRGFSKSPGFALTVIGTIGLALGLNTTMFSVFNAYVLRPLAVHDPYSLYSFYWISKDGYGHRFTLREYSALAADASIFRSVLAQDGDLVSLNGVGAFGQIVSANYFEDLRAGITLGRALAANDRNAIVISRHIWESRFGADPLIVGRKVYVRGMPVEVVGVAADEFAGLTETPTDFWAPLALSTVMSRKADLFGPEEPERLSLVVRLRPGLAPETAEAGLQLWARRITASRAPEKRATVAKLVPNATMVPFNMQGFAMTLPIFIAFGLVLVIACANVSNMMLARALSRQREIGIRVSLGAGRGRLVRQLLTESLLLALPAAGFGFAVSQWTLKGASWLLFKTLPPAFSNLIHLVDLTADARVFGYVLAASAGATILFGLMPAVQTTRTELVQANRGDFSSDHRPSRLRNALVVTQVAVCALLLICAGVIFRSQQRVVGTRLGLEPRGVLDLVMQEKFRVKAAERLAREPLVEAIAVDWRTPLYGSVRRMAITPSGGREAVPAGYNFVSPGYFAVFRIPVRRGRNFSEAEASASAPLAIVSESTARRLWPGRDALGESIAIAAGPKERDPGFATARVIGIAADAIDGFAADQQNATGIYFPTHVKAAGNDSVLVRVRGDSAAARRAIEASLDEIAPGIVDQTNPMEDVAAAMTYPFRAMFWISGFLGGLALVLTATGIYGVMSYLVSQRTKEIGIRVALGASAASVVRLVMTQSMRLAAIGVAVGAAGALMVAPVFANQLSAVNPFEPVAYGGAVALIAIAAAAACWHPSRRAAGVDPISALRCD